jgi:hypothetical protein
MSSRNPSRPQPVRQAAQSGRTAPRLQQRSFDQDYVTVRTRVRRPPPGAGRFDLESSGRHAIGALIEHLRHVGGDPRRITRTSIGVKDGDYCRVLAAVRDEILEPGNAVHSIYLLDDDADDAFVTEFDAARIVA